MAYDLAEDEDELDPALEMEGGTPNVPRNPDAEADPRAKIKDYLERQGMVRADPEMRKMGRASLDELRGSDRDIAFQNLLQKSAAQMGTIGGKAAPTGAFDEFSKNLMAQNAGARGDIMGQRKDAAAEDDRQIKIRKYMADKMMDDKQKAAALAERQASRTSTEDYRGKMLALKEKEIGAKAGKKEEDLAQLNVPGYERTGEVMQSPDEAKKTRDAIGISNNIKGGLDTLKNQMEKYGNFELGGQGGTEMAVTAGDLRLQLKELNNLGVLSGPDYQLMLEQIPDTQSFNALMTRPDVAKAQLNQVISNIDRKVQNSMAAKGYRAKAAPTTPPTTAMGAIGAGQSKVPADLETLPDDELDRLYREAGGK
jgi:hypothetical protein